MNYPTHINYKQVMVHDRENWKYKFHDVNSLYKLSIIGFEWETLKLIIWKICLRIDTIQKKMFKTFWTYVLRKDNLNVNQYKVIDQVKKCMAYY